MCAHIELLLNVLGINIVAAHTHSHTIHSCSFPFATSWILTQRSNHVAIRSIPSSLFSLFPQFWHLVVKDSWFDYQYSLSDVKFENERCKLIFPQFQRVLKSYKLPNYLMNSVVRFLPILISTFVDLWGAFALAIGRCGYHSEVWSLVGHSLWNYVKG